MLCSDYIFILNNYTTTKIGHLVIFDPKTLAVEYELIAYKTNGAALLTIGL